MPLEVNVVGAVEAFSTVSVRAQVTGELKAVNFDQGEDVKAGQVLFTLDRRPLEAALNQAEANLARDTAQAANAKVIAQRMDDLVERGVGTREQRDTARTTAAALDAVVGANTAAVENARVQLPYATILAPISGRTGALMVHAGNLVRANDQTPLVVIDQVALLHLVRDSGDVASRFAALHGGTDARSPGDPPERNCAAGGRPHHVRGQRGRPDHGHYPDASNVPQ